MVTLSPTITDTSRNFLETVKQEPIEHSGFKIDDFEKNFPIKSVDIQSVDVKLKKRIIEFQKLDNKATAYKVLTVVLGLFLVIGWIPAYFAWKKACACENAKEDRMFNVSAQISKDANRKVLVILNGTQYYTPRSLINALDEANLSDVEKYTVLQLAHQGVYATLLNACYSDLLNYANTHAPLTQEEDQPLSTNPKGDPAPYHHVREITMGQGKEIYLRIADGVSLLSSNIQLGVSVFDKNAKGAHRDRVIFEFDTSFQIDWKEGKMCIQHRLDKINPLTGPVPLYYGEQESGVADAAASSTENSERDADTPSPICDSEEPSIRT